MRSIQKTIAEFIEDDQHYASVSPGEMVSTAVLALEAHKSDCAIVLDKGVLVGIFTERDFLNRVAAADKDPATTPVREVMTSEPETLGSDDCISYAINLMVVRGFRNIPIVDEDGHPSAVLDVRDVMAHLSQIFAEVEEGPPDDRPSDNEWVDIGGGG